MQVILLKDVASLGRRFDVVDVSKGYAMNKLIPRGLAQPATKSNIASLEDKKRQSQAEIEADLKNFSSLCGALRSADSLVVRAKANEDGTLFQALPATEIATQLSDVAGKKLSPDFIELSTPIKHTGKCDITLSCLGQREVITIEVESL